ncbi:hypothetical protein ACFWM0_06205 [Streptomyces sp. NPDC058405]|uniref:hypothetical protein n=1 Tax=unclassified Streptomyces TaxID=2593676 RepID=UPI003666D539
MRAYTRAQSVLEDFPITCVESRWLHITVDQITDAVGAGISPAARDALVEELGKRLADVEPFEIMIGSLESYATEVAA